MMHKVLVTLLLLLGCVSSMSTIAHAQIDIPEMQNAISLSISPEHPTPGSTVHVTAVGSSIDLSLSNTTWTVDGTPVETGEGITEIDVPLGTLGKGVTIGFNADSNIFSGSAQITVVPTQVDLLWEADSYTPPFYSGKALPSAGSALRLQAIARFMRPDGSIVPSNSIKYTWKKDGRVIGSVSGKGKASVSIPAPSLYGSSIYSVEAISADNLYTGSASTRISSIEPKIALYEDHPLFGLMYWNPIGTRMNISESEMGFVAIPYFIPTSNIKDRQLTYNWVINNTPITPDETEPNKIIINADNSSGSAAVQLGITHMTNFFLDSAASWFIQMAAQSTDKPTLAPNTQDAFHTNTDQ